jgi:hypothetical protein
LITAVTAGAKPIDLNMRLPRDADFVWNITNNAGAWAAGDRLELHLSATDDNTGTVITWTATIVDAVASWKVPNTGVLAAIAAGVKYARLHYYDAAGDNLLWMAGRANVD